MRKMIRSGLSLFLAAVFLFTSADTSAFAAAARDENVSEAEGIEEAVPGESGETEDGSEIRRGADLSIEADGEKAFSKGYVAAPGEGEASVVDDGITVRDIQHDLVDGDSEDSVSDEPLFSLGASASDAAFPYSYNESDKK